ncbi:hypothetical protein FB451DRAFT_1179953 [Mycena latifolia]|nr:hypothetical protein FB451DRAFT_1179953 [Mycena latifolia]
MARAKPSTFHFMAAAITFTSRWIGSITTLITSGGLISGRLVFELKDVQPSLLYGGSLLMRFSLFMRSLFNIAFPDISSARPWGRSRSGGSLRPKHRSSLALVPQTSARLRQLSPRQRRASQRAPLRRMRSDAPPPTAVPNALVVLEGPAPLRPRCTLRLGDAWYFPLFYLQLDAITHGTNKTLALHSVRPVFFTHQPRSHHAPPQLVILSASSFVGRLAPGFFARKLGIINMVVASPGCGTVLILRIIALKNSASLVSAVCSTTSERASLLAVLTEDLGELGLRIGVAYGFLGFGRLARRSSDAGPPIHDALLAGKFIWWRPALFSRRRKAEGRNERQLDYTSGGSERPGIAPG